MTTWRVSVVVATPSQADYPGLRSLVLVDKTTVRKRDLTESCEQRAYASSLAPAERSPAQMLALIRRALGRSGDQQPLAPRRLLARRPLAYPQPSTPWPTSALLRSVLLRVCAQHWPERPLPHVFESCQHSTHISLRAIRSHS
ncbi:MAG: hypothetical protein J6386_23570 [Candidatus Synoicihabitans palmerolidicus]|nr:hypothetical protein [Candidatus Synoicihabitans palmerolidicus]